MRLLLACVLLVGCGSASGDGADPSSSPASPTSPVAMDDAGTSPPPSPDADAPDTASADAEETSAHACALFDATLAKSKWVHVEGDELVYATLPRGDRILDFSVAGYMGGGVAIPDAPVRTTLKPSGGDDTAAIQKAIDDLAKQPLPLRGAVLLSPGDYSLGGSITLSASGIVLRGSGESTVLKITGAPRTVFSIGGTGSWKAKGTPTKITDAYVPSGTRTFHVASTAGLSVGQPVLVDRTVTDAWIHFMGMDTLVRDGSKQTWLSDTTVIHSDRVITAIAGDSVTVDAPISDGLDAKYTAVTLVPYTFDGRIEQVGLESMHVVAPKQTAPIDQPTFTVMEMDAALNGWVRKVTTEEFTFGFVVGSGAKWITIEDSAVTRTAPIDNGAGYPFHYSIAGQQTLVQRCSSSSDDMFSYATQARTPGPNVVLKLVAKGNRNRLQPHQRWATGLLVDSVDSPAEEIDLIDRGTAGSGHGWAIGWSVVWNSDAASLLVEQPPGAQNWAIGSTGKLATASEPGSSDTTPLPTGIIDSPGKPVSPRSLYLGQLCHRLGPKALSATGW